MIKNRIIIFSYLSFTNFELTYGRSDIPSYCQYSNLQNLPPLLSNIIPSKYYGCLSVRCVVTFHRPRHSHQGLLSLPGYCSPLSSLAFSHSILHIEF